MTSLAPLEATAATRTQGAPAAETARAAGMLEGVFLHELLKVMRTTVPESALFGENLGKDIFAQMFDEAVAGEVSRGEGIGLRQLLLEQLGGGASGAERGRGSAALARLSGASPQRATEALRQVASWTSLSGADPDATAPGSGLPLGGVDFEAPSRPEPVAVRDPDGRLRWPVDQPAPETARISGGWTLEPGPGAEILAAGSGLVVAADRFSLTVDHGGGLLTRYLGLGQVLAQRGDLVLRGQTVGSVGGQGAFAFLPSRAGKVVEAAEITAQFEPAPSEEKPPQVR